MNISRISPNLDGKDIVIGIVMSRFNSEIGDIELDYCLKKLISLGVSESNIFVVTVPGALEIAVAMHHMIENKKIDSLIALGAVIRGETFHFDIVSNGMAYSISQISLKTGIPIANGVLTVDCDQQANSRAAQKGEDCAEVAVEMANLISKFRTSKNKVI